VKILFEKGPGKFKNRNEMPRGMTLVDWYVGMAEEAFTIQQNVLAIRRVEGEFDYDSPKSSGLTSNFNLNLSGQKEPSYYPEQRREQSYRDYPPNYNQSSDQPRDHPPRESTPYQTNYPEQRRDQPYRESTPNYPNYPDQRRDHTSRDGYPNQNFNPEPKRFQSPRDVKREDRGMTPQTKSNDPQRFGNPKNEGNQSYRGQGAPNPPTQNQNYSSNTPVSTGDPRIQKEGYVDWIQPSGQGEDGKPYYN
jgi:hypothetical protein